MAGDSHSPGSISGDSCNTSQHYLPKLIHSNNQAGVSPPTFPPGVPMPPVQTFPAEFECQLCFQVIKLSEPKEWTTHVYQDLQPFTCTYEECGDLEPFKRRAEWSRHENERHRQAELWVCGESSAGGRNHGGRKHSGGRISYTCLKGYVRKDNFEEHLKTVHKFSNERAKTMVEECHYMKNNPGNKRQLDLWVCRERSVSGKITSKGAGNTSDVCLKGHLRADTFKLHLRRAHKLSDKQAKAMAEEYYYIKPDRYSLQDVGHRYQEHYQQQRKRKRKQARPLLPTKKVVISASSLVNAQQEHEPKKAAVEDCRNKSIPQTNRSTRGLPHICARDEFQKLLVWYSNLPAPPAEIIDVKGTAAAIQFCEILRSCQMKGVDNMRLELNLREPTLISNYSVRIIQIVIQSGLKRRKVQELLAWYGSLPKPLTKIFGIGEMAALAQVCEIIQTCQRSGVDAVHRDMKLQLNYSIRNIRIGIQSATLLQDNNEETQIE